MNCNCIEDIEKKLVGLEFGRNKKKILEAKIPTGILFGKNSLIAITSTEVELTVDGYKKPQRESIVHSYCPFCGKKIDKGEAHAG